jgi:competence protein ComEA
MAIEDFEWHGEVEITRPSQARLAQAAGVVEVEAKASGWLAGLRKSVWIEPALRLFGMAALLGVLAGIGVVATTYAKPGHELPLGSRSLAAALGTSWLKPSPVAPAPVQAGPATSASTASPGTGAPASVAVSADSAVAAPASEPPAEAPSPGAPAGVTADGRVILNLASADELTKLPGIGMKRAQAIVALRTKLKRFKHPTDLLRVKGIGPRGLQRMLPHLVLDAPG